MAIDAHIPKRVVVIKRLRKDELNNNKLLLDFMVQRERRNKNTSLLSLKLFIKK